MRVLHPWLSSLIKVTGPRSWFRWKDPSDRFCHLNGWLAEMGEEYPSKGSFSALAISHYRLWGLCTLRNSWWGAIRRIQVGTILSSEHRGSIWFEVPGHWQAGIWRDIHSMACPRPSVSLPFSSWNYKGLTDKFRAHQHVTLKVYTRDEDNKEEFEIYKQLSKGDSSHPGYAHVRTALDIFTIHRSGGDHQCLVQKPMWESFSDLLYRNPAHRFTEELLRAGLIQVFLALDYLHTECKLVHTGM